jgi:alcohol dehydrogenase
MRAYVLTRYGGPESMEPAEVPVPTPGRNELLVRVHAAGLNPVDYKTREGTLRPIVSYSLPVVGGNELAGVVESIGSAVIRFAPGDRVFARLHKTTLGAFAEYAAVDEALVAKMPQSLDFVTAAGVPLAGLTALEALREELAVAAGQKIFISGGAGGVGTFAIQIAKRLGATVATTASERGAELVRRLGADVVIDYQRERFEEQLAGYDGAFDLIGGATLDKTFHIVKPGGQIVSIAGLPEPTTAWKDLKAGWELATLFWFASLWLRWEAWRYGVTYRYLFMHGSGSRLAELAALIDAGSVQVVIDRVFPFSEIAGAMAYLEQGHAKGKVVVRMV